MGALARLRFFVNGRRFMTRRQKLEAEERNSLALGAMEGLGDLIGGLDPRNRIDPGKFYYLFQAVHRVVRDAIQPAAEHGGRHHHHNDDER
jgi:hypothetical protein